MKTPRNSYMEREWRTRTSIHCSVNDVYRVILPESYKDRFRREYPDYSGETRRDGDDGNEEK